MPPTATTNPAVVGPAVSEETPPGMVRNPFSGLLVPAPDHTRPNPNPASSSTAPTPSRARRPAPAPAPVDIAAAPAAPAVGGGSFADLAVPAPLVTVLAGLGAHAPFPIQAATLPSSLTGRDVLGRGRTGSGKTIAFAVPVVARLAAAGTRRRPGRPRALVLLPTRELATQVAATLTPLAHAMGLSTTVVFGGVKQGPQVAALTAGVDILIACPGRLEDLIRQQHVSLASVEVTVLDEADHMADMGFLPVVRRILDTTGADGQRLLFSATLDNGIDVLVDRYLTDPVIHAVDPVDSAPVKMDHHVLVVDPDEKAALVRALATGTGRRVLFTRTKHAAKKLARQLTAAGVPAVDLHGNLSQNARQANLAAFTSGRVRVLVATDIAARGIHVDGVDLVVHVDPPTEHKAYTHRSGRTARAGNSGVVVTVATGDQLGDVASLTKAAGVRPTRTPVTATHPLVADLAA